MKENNMTTNKEYLDIALRLNNLMKDLDPYEYRNIIDNEADFVIQLTKDLDELGGAQHICDELQDYLDDEIDNSLKEDVLDLIDDLNSLYRNQLDEINVDKDILTKITYDVTVEEHLIKTVTIEARSKNDAEEIAKRMYKNEEIVLYPDDFNGVDFTAEERVQELDEWEQDRGL